MKTLRISLLLLSLLFFKEVYAQSAPVWTQVYNPAAPGTLYPPVKTITDASGNVLVLVNEMTDLGIGNFEYKVTLIKYDASGNLVWTFSSGNSVMQPRGTDLAIDSSGNYYIAGQDMATGSFKPFLVKVDASGSQIWVVNSTTAFAVGGIETLKIVNNEIYFSATTGSAKFDLNGIEVWSNIYGSSFMAVNTNGDMVLSTYSGNDLLLIQLNSAGVVTVIDSFVLANRVIFDNQNNIYILNDSYELRKYSSLGSFQWSYTSFPAAPPFGDIGYDMVIDNAQNVIVGGVSDSIFKIDPSGALIWKHPTNGLDAYSISMSFTADGYLAIVGCVPGFGGYNIEVNYFNSYGIRVWRGVYNGTTSGFEYTVSMTIDLNGVYVLENNDQYTELIKFTVPNLQSGLCIDSVWYDPLNPGLINVSVYNYGSGQLNYPSVQIVDSIGNVISNTGNNVTFFAHIPGANLVYTDSIQVQGITDFSNYTFLIWDDFGTTSFVISFCTITQIKEPEKASFIVYPNPAADRLYIKQLGAISGLVYKVVTPEGNLVREEAITNFNNEIDISELSRGVYFLILSGVNSYSTLKFIKM